MTNNKQVSALRVVVLDANCGNQLLDEVFEFGSDQDANRFFDTLSYQLSETGTRKAGGTTKHSSILKTALDVGRSAGVTGVGLLLEAGAKVKDRLDDRFGSATHTEDESAFGQPVESEGRIAGQEPTAGPTAVGDEGIDPEPGVDVDVEDTGFVDVETSPSADELGDSPELLPEGGDVVTDEDGLVQGNQLLADNPEFNEPLSSTVAERLDDEVVEQAKDAAEKE